MMQAMTQASITGKTGFRWLIFAAVALFLNACAQTAGPIATAPDPLGDFKLGYVIVVAKNAQRGPLSRKATTEMLEAAIKPELEALFSQYQGDKFYHIAISVDAYVLALPGVPIVASPKSALIMGLTIWDDATGTKLNAEPEQIIVLEKFSTKSIFGSGLTQNKDEQLAGLSKSTAKQIQKWMVENIQLFEKQSEATTTP